MQMKPDKLTQGRHLLQEKLHNAMVPCWIAKHHVLRALPKEKHFTSTAWASGCEKQGFEVDVFRILAKKRLLKEDRGSWEDFTYGELLY